MLHGKENVKLPHYFYSEYITAAIIQTLYDRNAFATGLLTFTGDDTIIRRMPSFYYLVHLETSNWVVTPNPTVHSLTGNDSATKPPANSIMASFCIIRNGVISIMPYSSLVYQATPIFLHLITTKESTGYRTMKI